MKVDKDINKEKILFFKLINKQKISKTKEDIANIKNNEQTSLNE